MGKKTKKGFDDSVIAGKATVRFARISPRKARLVADMIRYKTVSEAEGILKFTPKPKIVAAIKKLLDAAKASVNRREFPDVEELIIGDIRVDGGITLKRARPQSRRGYPTMIRRRTSHITIKLMPPL